MAAGGGVDDRGNEACRPFDNDDGSARENGGFGPTKRFRAASHGRIVEDSAREHQIETSPRHTVATCDVRHRQASPGAFGRPLAVSLGQITSQRRSVRRPRLVSSRRRSDALAGSARHAPCARHIRPIAAGTLDVRHEGHPRPCRRRIVRRHGTVLCIARRTAFQMESDAKLERWVLDNVAKQAPMPGTRLRSLVLDPDNVRPMSSASDARERLVTTRIEAGNNGDPQSLDDLWQLALQDAESL